MGYSLLSLQGLECVMRDNDQMVGVWGNSYQAGVWRIEDNSSHGFWHTGYFKRLRALARLRAIIILVAGAAKHLGEYISIITRKSKRRDSGQNCHLVTYWLLHYEFSV
jgi:hypothetical protein